MTSEKTSAVTPRTKSAIPVGTQFSPALINLAEALQAFVKHSGDPASMQTAIWKPPVHRTKAGSPSSRRVANLPLEAAVQYGLLTPRTYEATDLTRELAKLDGPALTGAFGRHIMLNLGGLRVVEAAEQMKADGLVITGDSLARYLTDQGFPVTEHNTAINSLRMWLAEAGVFSPNGWDVDVSKKEEVSGVTEGALAALVSLSAEQRAFAEALARLAPEGWTKASDVRDLAEATSGLALARSSLPKIFLEPLKQAGLIDYRTKGTAGGKTAELITTDKFDKDVVASLVAVTLKTLDPALSAFYKSRPEDIYADLESADKYKKGAALEAYVVYVMRLLGLRFVAWRKRAQEHTGQAEVDALLAGRIGAVPTRWQVQCKNTPSGVVRLEDVAKEVGLAPLTRATHILILANCEFTRDARRYATEINRQTSLTVVLLDRRDFEAIKASPGALGGILRREADASLREKAGAGLWTSPQGE